MNIAQKILEIESKLNQLNREVFVAQGDKVGVTVNYAIRRIEIKESTEILEIDALQNEIDLIDIEIVDLLEKITTLRVRFDSLLESLETI